MTNPDLKVQEAGLGAVWLPVHLCRAARIHEGSDWHRHAHTSRPAINTNTHTSFKAAILICYSWRICCIERFINWISNSFACLLFHLKVSGGEWLSLCSVIEVLHVVQLHRTITLCTELHTAAHNRVWNAAQVEHVSNGNTASFWMPPPPRNKVCLFWSSLSHLSLYESDSLIKCLAVWADMQKDYKWNYGFWFKRSPNSCEPQRLCLCVCILHSVCSQQSLFPNQCNKISSHRRLPRLIGGR